MLHRRAALLGLCCAGPARLVSAGPTASVARTDEIAPGIHVRRGADEDATALNADAIANTCFVIGRNAVAVIDPGGSLADGAALLARIRAVTDRPVSHVV